MIRRILIWVCALVLALTPIAHAMGDVQAEMDSIIAYASAGKPMQEWVDELAESAVGSADNYILALRHMGADCDFSAYARALAKSLEEGAEKNPVTRQKNALALIACGGEELVPADIADDTIGELGVMSYIFGLHLLNNGVPSEKWTADALVQELLQLRKADGGWAVTGDYANPDATAMCLQALANYDGGLQIGSVIDGAIALLSASQLENAGYSSYGSENPESTAQVIIALAALGIDPVKDARFIKGGRSLLDAMLDYKLPSGGYSHLAGGSESDMAAMQALQALSVIRSGGSFYDFTAVEAAEIGSSGPGWKLFAWIGIGGLGIIGCALSLRKKRGRAKRALSVLVVTAILLAGVGMIDIESAEGYYASGEISDPDGYVWLSIRCDTVAGAASDGSTPPDGVILPRTRIAFAQGDTVFDVLTRAAREHRIQMEHEGMNDSMAYVNGINYLYELAYGDLSGWMYSVGGEFVSTGCGALAVQDGDEIIWAYTTELGEDLK